MKALTWFHVCHFSAQVQVKKKLYIYVILYALAHSSYLYTHSKAFVSHMIVTGKTHNL